MTEQSAKRTVRERLTSSKKNFAFLDDMYIICASYHALEMGENAELDVDLLVSWNCHPSPSSSKIEIWSHCVTRWCVAVKKSVRDKNPREFGWIVWDYVMYSGTKIGRLLAARVTKTNYWLRCRDNVAVWEWLRQILTLTVSHDKCSIHFRCRVKSEDGSSLSKADPGIDCLLVKYEGHVTVITITRKVWCHQNVYDALNRGRIRDSFVDSTADQCHECPSRPSRIQRVMIG